MQEEQCKFLTHRLNAKAKESFGKRPFCRKDSRFAAAPHVPVCEMLRVFTTQICNFIMAADTASWYNMFG